MTTRSTISARLRASLLALLLGATSFVVAATPIAKPLTDPLGVGPKLTLAQWCASNPQFTGRLTASSGSTSAVSRITNPTVYGYLSNIDAAWSCTLNNRYSGVAWNTTPTLGTFDYGALIAWTGVGCNWAVGSTDFLKANSTTDCPDTDAEYAMAITLNQEGTYNNNAAHTAIGQFSFVHSDCDSTTFYGAERLLTSHNFDAGNSANRPGANCDPITLDGTGTAQTITYDATAPPIDFTTPNELTTAYSKAANPFVVTHTASDSIAGFGGANGWTLQRQIATVAAPNTCGTFANDTATGNLTTGVSSGTINTNQTLIDGKCYRWILTARDQNGNAAPAHTSGTVFYDTTAPTTDFGTPNEGTQTNQNTTAYSVGWTETETTSGLVSRSLQRKRAAWTSGSCSGLTFANDGAADAGTSPLAQTLATGFCYQWVETLTDRATNTSSMASGYVTVDNAGPTVNFATPDEGTTAIQAATSYDVAWSETAGSGTITSRSLQRQRAQVTTPNSCAGLSFANDGSPYTGASPSTSSGMLDGYAYRWVETLTNSVPKTGSSTSGCVVVDTTNPAGSITYPEANRPLGGTVTISGSATDATSFEEYQLEYGAGASPSSWTSIGTFSRQVSPSGDLATWATGSLSGVYTLRLTVRDNAAHSTAVTRLIYLDNSRRADESYWTRVPFELGGGFTLQVGVANGEATLDRDLFSIPSFGPPQALSLHYSSQEPTSTGRFGYGWVSNLSQYLTYENGFVVWHPEDGGIVPFGLVGSVWTPLRGHFETLARNATEDVITLKDQSKVVFDNATGRLKRIENRFGKALTLVWNASTATATDATTPTGRVTNLVLDGSGRITDATDSADRHWVFRYNASGDLDRITDPAGAYADLAYTAHQLTTVTRLRSRVSGGDETLVWSIGYSSGNATSVTDPVNATVANTFTYNPDSTVAGLLKEYAGPVRNSTTYTFDELGRVTSSLDADGYTTSSTFDADSDLTSVFHPITQDDPPVGQTVTYTYDARGNVLTESGQLDATTSVVTAYSYNATNDLLTRSESDNDAATKLVTLNVYDAAGHLLSTDVNCTTSGTTPPTNSATCTGAGTQDAATNLLTEYRHTTNDQLEYEHDPLGRVTKHVYDTFGNETATIANCTSSGTTPPSPWYSCTGAGTADAQTNVTTTHAFDLATTAGKAGLATSATDPVGTVTTEAYDALGRQTSEISPGDASIPALTHTTTYDQLGNTLTETDAWTGASRQTTHAYDLANRETSVTDPAGVATTTGYDAAGNAIASVSSGVQTDRTFDGRGDAVQETNHLTGDLTTHTFDGQRRDVETVDPKQVTTDRVFDRAGRLLSETVRDGLTDLTTSHIYDPLGRELTSTDEVGVQTTNTYDRTGRLTSKVVGASRTDHGYDRAGNETSSVGPYPSGGTAAPLTTTAFDPLNRTTVVVGNDVTNPTLPSEDVTTRTYYDAAGRTLAVKDPKGITTRSIMNVRGLAGQMIANCTDVGTTPTANPPACTGAGTHDDVTNVVTTPTYDGVGAVTLSIVAVGRPAQGTTQTAYDAAGRVQATNDPRGTITRNFYNASGQLTKAVVNCTTVGTTIPAEWANCTAAGTADGTYNLATSYTYDAHGNRASETAPNGRLTTYVYDGAGRLAQRIDNDVATPTQADQDLSTYYGYDDAGRQIAVRAPTIDRDHFAVTRTLFDATGRVIEEIRNCTNQGTSSPPDPDWITCQGTGTFDASTNLITTYAYDARGNRLSAVAADPSAASGTSTAVVTTRYAYDAQNRLCRVLENATVDLQGLADPCTTAVSGTATTNVSARYGYDGAGNLTAMIDGSGHTTAYAYDAAGNMTGTTDPDTAAVAWSYDNLGHRVGQTNRSDATPTTPTVSWTYDGAGRVLSRTYETAPPTDTAAPTVPTASASAVGATRVDVSWTAATDNVGVRAYTIRRNGVVLTAVSGAATSYADFAVAASTAYSYTVDAADAAGNTSAQSSAAGATTGSGAGTIVAADSYTRTGAGWGTADTGGAWTDQNTTDISTTGSAGQHSLPSATTRYSRLNALSAADQVGLVRVKASSITGSGKVAYARIETRADATYANSYRFQVQFDAAGTIDMSIRKQVAGSPSGLRTDMAVLSGVTAGSYVWTRWSVANSGPDVVLKYKLWKDGTTEPTGWSTTYTDVNPGTPFTAAGRLMIISQVLTGFGGTYPLVLTYDDLAMSTDTAAPSTPTGLTATADGPSRVDLAWTASTDGVGVAGYRIYRGGSLLATVGATSWTDAGLAPATAYSYTVAAVDASANASAQSTSANATTLPATLTTTYTYDLNGNRLTAQAGSGTITTAYDRLNRPTQVTVSSDSGATTTYSYSLTSPSWTDPSGAYAATLDRFDRAVSQTDPIHGASTWTTSYRADGQTASVGAPNGNTTAFTYDAAGRAIAKSTTAPGPVSRAAYAWTYNRAGEILSEDSTISGDPTNGTVQYAYDPLERLARYTPPTGSDQTYGWAAVPNRTSVQVGTGTPVTTAYDPANRPVSDSAGGAYTSDPDGRLTTRPGQRLAPDALGRLTAVRPATGTGTLATYAYDALDRLLSADEGGGRTRYRYVGLTTNVAQTLDDANGAVIRSIATSWSGERLVDWTGGGSEQRFYGLNGHHDTTWTADATGAVSATLRYDPWGTLSAHSGSSLPDVRFQGSLYDATTDLSWAVARWYAPSLGRFISEDSLLGQPIDPPSRHLYAYGHGEPIGRWDPDGRYVEDRWILSGRQFHDSGATVHIMNAAISLVCWRFGGTPLAIGCFIGTEFVVPSLVGEQYQEKEAWYIHHRVYGSRYPDGYKIVDYTMIVSRTAYRGDDGSLKGRSYGEATLYLGGSSCAYDLLNFRLYAAIRCDVYKTYQVGGTYWYSTAKIERYDFTHGLVYNRVKMLRV